MAEKTFNTRIVQKHDTESNWSSSDFIPKQGELIIYDADENYNYSRFKIGDGKSTVTELPFSNDIENVAFISEDDTEDIVVAETGSPYAGTVHRFSV